MAREMLINNSEGEECRIALLEDGRLEELYMERTSSTSHVGNIYKGRVTNVEASIQAAFVDFGLGRNGFLHITDLMPSYFGRDGGDMTESVGRKLARRDRPPIQRCLRRGDDILVQIIKEGIGTKGPTLSTYLSIPGRILVMMPGMAKFGVSRRIEDEDERRRLRQILDSLKPIDEVGFIIRTAGIGKTKLEIQRDLAYLTRVWQNIDRLTREPAPVELYTEGDLVTRTVRDVYTSDVERIVVDNKEVAQRVKEFFKIAMPRSKTKLQLYEGPTPLFHRAGIEREIEQMHSRHVPLPSGGSLVIDSTEAVVAIDVNSGKFREHADAETTAFKTDMEAADEIPRQLRLRDLGGVIICDFIDLRFERHRRDLELRLHQNLQKDRAKSRVLRMSQFGIIEMTRQRMRPSLKRSIYFDCPYCKGAGLVKTPESMSLDVARRLTIAANDERVSRIELSVSTDVATYLLNRKRKQLAEMEEHSGKRINVRADAALSLDGMRLELFDAREGAVWIPELGVNPAETQAEQQRDHGTGRRGGRGGDRRGGRTRERRNERVERPRGGAPVRALGPASGADDYDDQENHDEHDAAGALDQAGERAAAAHGGAGNYRDEEGANGGDRPDAEVGAVREPDSEDLSEAVDDARPRDSADPSHAGDEVGEPTEGGTLEMTGSDDESSVVEVDEAAEPIGEAPRGFDEDRYGNRGRNDRGGGRGGDRGRGRGGDRGGDRHDGRGRRDSRGRGGGDRGDRAGSQPQRGASSRPGPVQANPFHDSAGRDHHRAAQQAPSQAAPVQRGPAPRGPAPRGPVQRGPAPRPPVEDDEDNVGNRIDEGSRPAQGQNGPNGPNGPAGMTEDGQRRRRRRGGRRHRRRRERAEANRLAAERGEPLPYGPADLNGDDEPDRGPAAPTADRSPGAASTEQEPAEPVDQVEAEIEASADDPEVKAKRPAGRSRGGSKPRATASRSRRPAPKRQAPAADADAPGPALTGTSAQRSAPTGADKHLADDVPVDPDPPPRPRSFRDLDEIHGEFD